MTILCITVKPLETITTNRFYPKSCICNTYISLFTYSRVKYLSTIAYSLLPISQVLALTFIIFIYLVFYVTPSTGLVMLVRGAEETSKYS